MSRNRRGAATASPGTGAIQIKTHAPLVDLRYSFTTAFMRGGALFARRAGCIEEIGSDRITDELKWEHRAVCVSAVTQSVFALESEVWEVVHHGPGHHLGSGVDVPGRTTLLEHADRLDRGSVHERCWEVLKLLGKQRLHRGSRLWKEMALLVGLRNELVHYKSKWGRDMEDQELMQQLEVLGHPKPPFIAQNQNFFPHRCLSAACAAWSLRTAVAFGDAFYECLGFPPPWETSRGHIVV